MECVDEFRRESVSSGFNQLSLSNSGEATHLARDFAFITETEFPAASLAARVTDQHRINNENMQRRKECLSNAV